MKRISFGYTFGPSDIGRGTSIRARFADFLQARDSEISDAGRPWITFAGEAARLHEEDVAASESASTRASLWLSQSSAQAMQQKRRPATDASSDSIASDAQNAFSQVMASLSFTHFPINRSRTLDRIARQRRGCGPRFKYGCRRSSLHLR